MKSFYLEITYIALGFVLSVLGTLVVIIFKQMRQEFREGRIEFSRELRDVKSEISEVGKSVKTLNIEFAKVIENQAWHKEEIVEIKERLVRLEIKENHV